MKINEETVINILSSCEFFTDKENPLDVYVRYTDTYGVKRFVSTKNREFRVFVRDCYRNTEDTFIAPILDGYIQAFEDDAIVHKQETGVQIYRRLSGDLTNRIIYNLANHKGQTVHITAEGWKIKSNSTVHFLVHPLDIPQAPPIPGGDLATLLQPYINLKGQEFLLFLVYLISCFIRSDHFIAILTGAQGSGKSSTTKIIRELIDPNKLVINALPNTRSDLVTLLAANFLVCFDNTNQQFSENISDLLCAAVTGVTDAKRRLFSDSELVVLNLHNTVVLNGINAIPKKADFAERSLLFEMKKLEKTEYQSKTDLAQRFTADKPLILGAIFDTLSRAMSIRKNIVVQKRHRMADAHLNMLAIAMALGIKQEKFQAILDANNKKLQNAYAEQNQLIEALKHFMGSQTRVSGSATRIYRLIFDSIVGDKSFFPKSASALTRKLNEEREAIEAAGLRVIQGKTAVANTLEIKKIPQNQMKSVK